MQVLSLSFLHSLCASAVFFLFTQPLCQCCLCPFYTACVPVLSLSFLHSLCASAVFVLSAQPVCQCCLKSLPTVALYHCCLSLPSVCVCVYQLYVCVCVCLCVYQQSVCVCQLCVCVCVSECTSSLCMPTHNVDWRECLFKVQAVRGVWLFRSHQLCVSVPIVCV